MKPILCCLLIVSQALILQSKPVNSSFTESSETIQKPIVAVVDELPNFLWHLFASSNLWDKNESPYGNIYGSYMAKEDIDFLYSNRELIAWGNGRTGKFTRLLFFIPLGSSMGVNQYLDYLEKVSMFSDEQLKSEVFETYARNDYDIKYFSELSFCKDEIDFLKMYRAIVFSNYDSFLEFAWPTIQPALESDCLYINRYFANIDIVGQWEKLMKMKYEAHRFSPVLTYANAMDNLPSANNLSDSRNNFGATGDSAKYLLELVIHEVGIYILMPIIIELFTNPELQTSYIQENNLIYQAVESYIEFLKKDITGTSQLWQGEMHGGGNFDFGRFFKIYEKASSNNLSTKQLLEHAIIHFNQK